MYVEHAWKVLFEVIYTDVPWYCFVFTLLRLAVTKLP